MLLNSGTVMRIFTKIPFTARESVVFMHCWFYKSIKYSIIKYAEDHLKKKSNQSMES